MADMFDCGMSVFTAWAKGSQHQARYLGPFDPSMTADEAYTRLDMDKLMDSSKPRFVRGWNSAKADHLSASNEGTHHDH